MRKCLLYNFYAEVYADHIAIVPLAIIVTSVTIVGGHWGMSQVQVVTIVTLMTIREVIKVFAHKDIFLNPIFFTLTETIRPLHCFYIFIQVNK